MSIAESVATSVAAAPGVRIVFAGDDGWNELRSTFNVLDDLQPAAIAVPRDATEVVAAIAYARSNSLVVTGNATGHGASSLGDLSRTLLVSTSALTDVDIDAEHLRVRVGTGVRWADVTPQLSAMGLAALHGSSQDVGIAGYSLGGGIGWYTRKHGMQTNAVTGFEVVTATGEITRADASTHPDLFWALRGGNGNFGIVTSIEFRVLPIAEVFAGAYFYPVERTAEVLETWTALLPTLPDELTTWVTVFHFPPLPELPDFLRGQSLVVVMGVYIGDDLEAEGRRLMASFEALGPSIDTFGVRPPAGIGDLAMDPADPVPFRSTTALLDVISPEAIASICDVTARGSSLSMVQFRHGGAALGQVAPEAGARATLDGEIIMFALGAVPVPELEPVVRHELSRLDEAVAPHKVGEYPNFAEKAAAASTYFDDLTWARLRRVKSAYDPDEVFRGNKVIPAGEPVSL